ncbi:MAG: HipA N-terminal domain-containing protein [Lewinellaceae bacterium]|nr:HipA N-terminal domain-containing protein [Lewinellaceae bacterium]
MLTTTLDKISRWLKGKGQGHLSTPEGKQAVFALWYKDLAVGELRLENGVWSFRYTQMFKRQSEIKPVPDFPDLDRVYESKELHPFFMQRIPSLNQPKVKAKIVEEGIDGNNEVELLALFGKVSITNPFKLTISN